MDGLAKLCLEASSWPESGRMQPRSLGAIFGKLDREEELDWLVARPDVQVALARVLGATRETIQLALKPGRPDAEHERWVAWDSLPYARGLDLLEEDLFPGLPPELYAPARWRRLLWLAPSGSGRTLLGRWLSARGLARHVTLLRWGEQELPAARPLFVELSSANGFSSDQVPPGVCVALPEASELEPESDVLCVRSSPLCELLPSLVGWALERLPSSSRLDANECVATLRPAIDAGLLVTAGDLLGALGLADTEGSSELDAHGLGELSRSWLKRRARERLDPEAPSALWMRRHGYEALVALARRLLTDAREPVFCPRSLEDWAALLPAELRSGPDLEWLKLALPRADPNVREVDLERASQKLPPGAFRILRSFEQIGVLERRGEDLVLRPHFLLRVMLSQALASLVAGAAFDWGEALLSPSVAAATAHGLLVRAQAGELATGDEWVDPDARDPAYAAAIEGAVRALGIALLLGGPEPNESIEALWDEQVRLLFELPGAAPLPRVDYHVRAPEERGAWLLTSGAWYLAMLAASERLEANEGAPFEPLRPWQASALPIGLPVVLDEIALMLDRPETPAAVADAAVALVSRLRAALGPLGINGETHSLERAAIVADEAALGVLSWPSLLTLADDPVSARAVFHLLDARGSSEREFGVAFWQGFLGAAATAEAGEFRFMPELARRLLAWAPAEALMHLPSGWWRDVGTASLSAAQWRALFDAHSRELPLTLFEQAPRELEAEALLAATRALRRDVLAVFWQRTPDSLLEAVKRELDPARPSATDTVGGALELWLATAPLEHTSTIVEQLPNAGALLRIPAAHLLALRSFLHARITLRAPKLREIYALFDELERRCAPVRNASPAFQANSKTD
jgi:hypothetical protein